MPKKHRVDTTKLAIEQLGARHDKIVLASELESFGLPRQTIYYRARPGGVWQRILPGVIALFSGELTELQRIHAGLRYAGRGAIVTGLTALGIVGMNNLPRTHLIHLLIPQSRKRLSTGFVRIERTWRPPKPRWINGIPCAPPDRSAIDAARAIRDIDQVRAVLSGVVQRRKTTIDDLLTELAQTQQRGAALAHRVMWEVGDGIRSVAEAKVHELLAGSDLPPAKWNHDLYDAAGNHLACPDAIWEELGVVLEIDSYAWHLSPELYRRTQARQRTIAEIGLILISVAPTDVINDPTTFLDQVRQTLKNATGRPTPTITVKRRS